MKDQFQIQLPFGTDDERVCFATVLILQGFTFECRPQYPQFIVWADAFDRLAMQELHLILVGANASSMPEVKK
jgi:hypothetical protein